MKPSRSSWKTIKPQLATIKQENLLDLLEDLYALRKENQHYLHTRFSTKSTALEPYKDKIKKSMSHDVSQSIKVAIARKTISDYQKTVGNHEGLLELMMYYVECGINFAKGYGNIESVFYSSLEAIFARLLTLIKKAEPQIRERFLQRLRPLLDQARDIGWMGA